MNKHVYKAVVLFAIFAIFLSGCGTPANTTPTIDISAVQTSAAQTVVAQFTESAVELTPTLPVSTPTPVISPTPSPTQPAPSTGGTGNVTPCYSASFIADVTVPDGMLVQPGQAFTKTWRVKNLGSCPWDSSYKLILSSGDAIGAGVEYPLQQVINQDQTADLSIGFIAPTTEGTYTGYWRLATPYGGTVGFGPYNSSLSVKVTVSSNGSFAVTSVKYTKVRDPLSGCPAKGTYFRFTADITTNAPGTVTYQWVRNPPDSAKVDTETLVFKEAGTKTAYFDWKLQPDAIQDISRWVALYVISPNNQTFDRVLFTFSCP